MEKDILKLQEQIKSKPRYANGTNGTNGHISAVNHLGRDRTNHMSAHERNQVVNNHATVAKNQSTPSAIPDQVRPSIIRTPQTYVHPLGHNRRIVSYCWTKLEYLFVNH